MNAAAAWAHASIGCVAARACSPNQRIEWSMLERTSDSWPCTSRCMKTAGIAASREASRSTSSCISTALVMSPPEAESVIRTRRPEATISWSWFWVR